jgi:hypothetical protein
MDKRDCHKAARITRWDLGWGTYVVMVEGGEGGGGGGSTGGETQRESPNTPETEKVETEG